MAEKSETKNCPYCGEQILIVAKKCKHCGEWLEDGKERKGTSWQEKGSSDARSVVKGLKEKERQDIGAGCSGTVVLIIAIFIGTWISSTFNSSSAGWIVGLIVFIIPMILITKQYYKE
jgi:uncharacterized membrane protein YvbJ